MSPEHGCDEIFLIAIISEVLYLSFLFPLSLSREISRVYPHTCMHTIRTSLGKDNSSKSEKGKTKEMKKEQDILYILWYRSVVSLSEWWPCIISRHPYPLLRWPLLLPSQPLQAHPWRSA